MPSQSPSSSSSSSPLLFTETLREAAGDQWDRVVSHKFTTELAAGTIDRAVLRKYLVQDHRFLDAFVVLLASAVARARCLEDRIPGCQFLALITGKENTYFERCFEALGVTEADRDATPDDACTAAFVALMREASSSSLGEMLSVLVVCEWSYLSWGQAVLSSTNRDDFVTYEWVDLHTGAYFEGVIAYLRALLDNEGGLIDDESRDKCKRRFLQAVQCEEDFFDNAYL